MAMRLFLVLCWNLFGSVFHSIDFGECYDKIETNIIENL